LIEIVDYLFECNNNLHIDIYTNGSIRECEWWARLARVIGERSGYVVFGIDGASQKSALHRCNTDFDIIMRNARAFISAGGKAKWDYIVFKHNEDEVEKARSLASEMGFKEFNIKKTSRFFKTLYESDEHLDSTLEQYGKHPVFNERGEITHYLEMPENKDYRNSSEDKIFDTILQYGTYDNYLDKVSIDCGAIKTGGIFISASGEVYPCCTVYQQVCYGLFFGVKDESELNEFKLYNKPTVNLSALEVPLKDIVEGEFFGCLQKCWSNESLKTGKPKSCSRACGFGLDTHKSQHS
jgi:MoaA/NifB/PqqE/SkfB family radical SAM enzyme